LILLEEEILDDEDVVLGGLRENKVVKVD